MLLHRWHIQMLGGLKASWGTQSLTKFKSQKVASLLAYLAFYPFVPHSRDALQTLLWPEDDLDAVRNRLRVSLSSLRSQMEPPGMQAGTVLIADRLTVRLNPHAITTDVALFEEAYASAQSIREDASRVPALISVVELYAGDLLPGLYEEWVISERERLSQSFLQTLHLLTRALAKRGDYEQALYYARLATKQDSWREEAHQDVMRLYTALGQPSAALQQYEELKRTLQEGMGVLPSPSTQQLARQITESVGRPVSPPTSLSLPPLTLPARLSPVPASPIEQSTEATKSGGDAEVVVGHLPTYLTQFFGREQECTRLRELLIPASQGNSFPSVRLVTLTGLGGNGKTRLAVAAAQQLRPALENRIWFVPLTDLSDASMISDAIIGALRLPRTPLTDPFTQICTALQGRPTLLILDNFEHLAEEGAAFVGTLLEHTPSLACLVTSRRTLGLPGEREFPVPPLPVPEEGEASSTAQHLDLTLLPDYASVRLFVDRAQANRPDFQITARNAGEVAALCRELEGIPLAIELAAARARVLTPAQMRSHLSHRFDLLVDRRADKDSRHRSLWATIEWSYRLLPHPLRRLFAQFSQFTGGWSLDAAQAVCQDNGTMMDYVTPDADPLLLDALERLRIEALIETREVGDEIRFTMLETLREFAAEQLSSEERTALSRRYVRYFVAFAEEARGHLRGAQQAVWLDRLQRERDNLRAVFELCLENPESAEEALRLLRALERFWIVHGLIAEGRLLATRVLAHPGGQSPTALRARALITAGTLHAHQDDYETASTLYQQSLETAQAAGDISGEAWALDNLGTIELRRGQHATAHAYFERSLAMHRTANDLSGIAAALSHLGSATHVQGDYRTAQKLFEESLLLHRQLGDLLHVATTLSNLGLIFDLYGEYAAARRHYEQSQAIHQELDNKIGSASALLNLGIVAAKLHDYAMAHQYFEEALALVRTLGFRRGIALVLGNLGSLEETEGRSAKALPLLEEALEIQREIGDRNGVALTLANIGRVHLSQGDYARGKTCLIESLTLARDLDLRRGIVEGLEGFAALADVQQQPLRAIRLYSAADALRTSLRMPLDEHLRAGRERDYATLREIVTDTEFDTAWTTGNAASLAASIALALLIEP